MPFCSGNNPSVVLAEVHSGSLVFRLDGGVRVNDFRFFYWDVQAFVEDVREDLHLALAPLFANSKCLDLAFRDN